MPNVTNAPGDDALNYLENNDIPIFYMKSGTYEPDNVVMREPNFSKADTPQDGKLREEDEAMLASPAGALYETFLRRSAWEHGFSNQPSWTQEAFVDENRYNKYTGNPHNLDNRVQIEYALSKVEDWQRQGLVDKEGKLTAPELAKALKTLPVQIMLGTVDEGVTELKRICNEINTESGVDVSALTPEEWVVFYEQHLKKHIGSYSEPVQIDLGAVQVFGKDTGGKGKTSSRPVHITAVPVTVEGREKKVVPYSRRKQLVA